MGTNLDRRQFLLGSTALLAAGAALPAFAQDKRMRVIFWGGQARADRTVAVEKLYTAAKGYSFDQEFAAFNDYWPKLATQVAGGNAPDVIQMDYRYVNQYANQGAIAALDDYVGKGLKLDDFDKDQIEGGKVGGKLVAISLGANSVALMVNKQAFADTGVPEPTRDWTYEDYKKNAEAFNAKSNGMRILPDSSGSEPALENWLRQQGKSLYTADGQLAFDGNDMVEWFKLWADLRAANALVSPEDEALNANAAVDNDMITLGKAATGFANSNQLVAYQAVNKAPLTMVNYPRIKPGSGGGHYRKPSMFWSVNPKSAILSDAIDFVNFFINDPEAGKALGVERGIPCSASVRAAITPTLDAQSQIALNFVSNLGDLIGALPPTPPAAAGEIDVSLLTAAQQVAFGQATPEDAGPAFVQQANDIIARQKKG